MSVSRQVLLADDEPEIRAVIADYLEEEGFEVRLAANGREAIAQARSELPDVLVLDVVMPDMGAAEVLEVWSRDGQLKGIPVILVSTAPDLTELAQVSRVRASIAKPFDLDVLRAVVEQVIAHPSAPGDTATVP